MKEYLANNWIRLGLGLAVFGAAPLLAFILLSKIGLRHDPRPNDLGPGLLFFFTFWPAVICLVVGVREVNRHGK